MLARMLSKENPNVLFWGAQTHTFTMEIIVVVPQKVEK